MRNKEFETNKTKDAQLIVVCLSTYSKRTNLAQMLTKIQNNKVENYRTKTNASC